jgi:hypothetical protein
VEPLLLCLLCFFRLLSTSVNHLDVIVEYCSDDGNHVCLHHSCPHILRPSDSNIHHALERQIPLPHVHHILTPPRLKKAYQSFDTSIDSEDVSYPGRGGGQVSEMIERIDERQRRRAIESSAVIQGGGDADRCLVDIGDAEIDFPHDGVVPHNRGEWRRVSWSRAFQLASKSGIIVLGRQADAACSNGSRCISGWRRVRDAGCDGFDVSWPREVIGCREPWGLTMWAWTWNDGTNGP